MKRRHSLPKSLFDGELWSELLSSSTTSCQTIVISGQRLCRPFDPSGSRVENWIVSPGRPIVCSECIFHLIVHDIAITRETTSVLLHFSDISSTCFRLNHIIIIFSFDLRKRYRSESICPQKESMSVALTAAVVLSRPEKCTHEPFPQNPDPLRQCILLCRTYPCSECPISFPPTT